MKRLIFVTFACLFLFIAWFPRSAFNRPKSVVVTPATNNIPAAFSNAAGSLVLQNLSSGQYQHVQVLNETNYPISFLTLPEVSTAPSSTVTGQRMHIVSNGASSFDDISIFDNFYLQSEEGAINQSGKKVRVNIW